MHVSDLRHGNAALEQRLQVLYRLNRRMPVSFDLRQEYKNLLHGFGDPHLSLPPVIHVAGTNGKGSVIAFLRAMLEAQGLRVHVYTSPHLVHFNERIVLGGVPIDDESLLDLIEEALRLNQDADLTFFEITTAMAFAAFARSPADVLLLEVGMGGRLDCTNIVQKPLATAITAIGDDHREFLGDTLGQIAAEKAGIMKRGVPCIIGLQTLQALAGGVGVVFEQTAQRAGCSLFMAGRDWQAEAHGAESIAFHWGDGRAAILPRPALSGPHQIRNAGTAIAVLHAISQQIPVSTEALAAGLQNVRWPARLQNISTGFPALPPGWRVWLDGGHNENAAGALAAQAQIWAASGRDLHGVLGMMGHKNPLDFLRPLKPFFRTMAVMPIPGEGGSLTAPRLNTLDPLLNATEAEGDIHETVGRIVSQNFSPSDILICGSLYLAGEILRQLETLAADQAQKPVEG